MSIDWDAYKSANNVPLGTMLTALENYFGDADKQKEAIRAFRAANPMPMPVALTYSGSAPMDTRWVPFAWAVDALYTQLILKQELI